MHDFMEILSFFAYDIEAVKEYVEAISAALPDKSSVRLQVAPYAGCNFFSGNSSNFLRNG